jgi:hypothetical protein
VPTKLFFQELKKRNIVINKELREIWLMKEIF